MEVRCTRAKQAKGCDCVVGKFMEHSNDLGRRGEMSELLSITWLSKHADGTATKMIWHWMLPPLAGRMDDPLGHSLVKIYTKIYGQPCRDTRNRTDRRLGETGEN